MSWEGSLLGEWGWRVLCAEKGRCRDGECERLHLPHHGGSFRDPSRGHGKLIVCAGPQRSGSTWLFNALRLVLEHSRERVHSYWLHTITEEKLCERGVGWKGEGSAHVLIKTHDWSDQWNPETADLIVLTERDVCEVANSYLRVGWQPNELSYLKSITVKYLEDHLKWKKVAHAVIQFEDLADIGSRELSCINDLVALMDLRLAVDAASISAEIKNLPIPSRGSPDPLTKLWPRHTTSSDGSSSRRPRLSDVECEALKAYIASILTKEIPGRDICT